MRRVGLLSPADGARCLALAAPLLVGCGGASDVAGGSGNVQDAVSHIPADATFASITDWGTIREQNPEDGSDSDEGLGQLLNVRRTATGAVRAGDGGRLRLERRGRCRLGPYLRERQHRRRPAINLVKVGDSVDLDDFQAGLEDQGFSSKDVEGGTVWTIDMGASDPSHAQLSTWLVDKDERIVRAGLMPPEDSLTTDGDPSEDMLALADEVGEATVMRLNVGESACQPVDPVRGIDPSQIEDQLEDRQGSSGRPPVPRPGPGRRARVRAPPETRRRRRSCSSIPTTRRSRL